MKGDRGEGGVSQNRASSDTQGSRGSSRCSYPLAVSTTCVTQNRSADVSNRSISVDPRRRCTAAYHMNSLKTPQPQLVLRR